MSATQYKKDPQTGEIYVSATGHFAPILDADGNEVDQEFVPDDVIEVKDPAAAAPVALAAPEASRYLLNTTKSTYHTVDCVEAVSGSLRTLEEIATLNPDAKPCGKCAPPALVEAEAG